MLVRHPGPLVLHIKRNQKLVTEATSDETIEPCDKQNQRVRPSMNVSEKQVFTHKLIHEELLTFSNET